ncbi:unnamed protein product [Mytilus coruscus]|uniref:Uncharacterized protein n=1 Tax=Mytilus coruscus TaxID=42192 RepID=A0A6J7ZWY6_MYTCO|nr:unnamed protein product [Mytilus coruscus]
MELFTDSAGSAFGGCASYLHPYWAFFPWPSFWEGCNILKGIKCLELVHIILAFNLWYENFANRKTNLHVDNKALVHILNSKTSRSRRPKSIGPTFIHFGGNYVTRYQFNAVLKKALNVGNVSSDNFQSHSFRIGAASQSSKMGFSHDEIQDFGRWESKVYKTYIRIPTLNSSIRLAHLVFLVEDGSGDDCLRLTCRKERREYHYLNAGTVVSINLYVGRNRWMIQTGMFTSSQKLKSHNYATASTCDDYNKDVKSKRTFSNHKCTYCKHCSTVFSSVQKLNQHLGNIKVAEDATKPTIKLVSKEKKPELIKTIFCKSSVEIKRTESEFQKDENIVKNKEDTLSDTNEQYVKLHKVFKEESKVVDQVKDKRRDNVQGRNITKNNLQNVSTKAASNDELIYLGIQQTQDFTFNPIDMKWQAVQTIKFKLPVLFIHHFVSSESLIQVPTDIHPIVGDGNFLFRAVSFIMTGSEDNHEAVRKHLTAYMMTIPQELLMFYQTKREGDLIENSFPDMRKRKRSFRDTHDKLPQDDKELAKKDAVKRMKMLRQKLPQDDKEQA